MQAGQSMPLFDPGRDLPWALVGSRARRNADRFIALARGFAVLHPDQPGLVGDGRYAMRPDRIVPLWGMAFDPAHPDATPRFVTDRSLSAEDREALWALLWGETP